MFIYGLLDKLKRKEALEMANGAVTKLEYLKGKGECNALRLEFRFTTESGHSALQVHLM